LERPALKSCLLIFSLFALLGLTIGCTKSPTSPGSGQWEEVTSHAPFSGRYGLSGAVFNGVMWVVGGAAGNADNSVTYYDADVWSSGNGSSWTQATGSAPFGGRYGSQVLSYNGKLWLLGGNSGGTLKNDVWNSPDGENWTQVPAVNQFTPREDFGAVVFNNAMWVIGGWAGGNKNDVWSSVDGINWTLVTANGGFAARWGMSTLVYNNTLWLISGASSISANSDPTAAYGDVWSSVNGSVWTQVTNLGPYNLSYFHQVVPNGGLMWLTGGFLWNNWGSQATVWTTGNGLNWSNVYSVFPPRFYHLSLSYNNQVWVIAGCDDYCDTAPTCAITYLNDVWTIQ
jgi:leucine-zipper-like transcriptional regulator 1